jgi:hypothetical protein
VTQARPIVFLSDFGLDDEFVGTCHGVIARIAPDGRIIDLTHGIPRQDVLRGAVVLARSLPYMPKDAVFLAVVDPGVGTGRRRIAVSTPSGQLLVGPDNGLLQFAWEALGGAMKAFEVNSREAILEPLSATFHARDVFAPAAAMLATGFPLEELGDELEPRTLVTLPWVEPHVEPGRIRCQVLSVDRFGNVALNARAEHLREASLDGVPELVLDAGGRSVPLAGAVTFGDLEEGQVGLLEDSSGWQAVVLNGESAATALGLRPGDGVLLHGTGG